MDHLRDQHVLVLGLGTTGLAMALWCMQMGAKVTVIDTRAQPPQAQKIAEYSQCTLIHSDFSSSSIQILFDEASAKGTGFRAVFSSPGLSPAQTSAILDLAVSKGLWVTNELGLFWVALSNLRINQRYDPKVLAITGTNGKTTVTALTTALLSRAGVHAVSAGNIGPSMLEALSSALASGVLPEVWVLELSSFQLAGVKEFNPYAAALLNISEDHLDWHGTMQAYTNAKMSVFGTDTLRILNADDPAVMQAASSQANTISSTTGKNKSAKQRIQFVLTSTGLPQREGEYGLETSNGMTWLVRAAEADGTSKGRRNNPTDLHIQKLMPADALRIRGRHNAHNALTALALALSTGAALAPMLYGLREYGGEPHRIQYIGSISGVSYFDDSKGTNVGASLAAISSLGAEHALVLILGGVGKGQDFSKLTAALKKHAKAVVLIGCDAKAIEAVIDATACAVNHAISMADAVGQCERLAQSGDAVLLSPACASLDMFDNYAHRGRVFFSAVEALALAKGVAL